MIVTIIIQSAAAMIAFIAGHLPNTPLPLYIAGAVNFISYSINNFSYILPVSTIFIAVGLVVSYEAIIWTWHGFLWLYKKMPFIGR